MNTLVCNANSFSVYCYSSHYFPIVANKPEVSPIGLLPRLGIRWKIFSPLVHDVHFWMKVFKKLASKGVGIWKASQAGIRTRDICNAKAL